MAVHVGSGDDMKVWNLPEKLLKSNSTFFTAALQSGFAEGISKIITLPEEDPDMFEYFVEWIYVGYGKKNPFEPDFFVSLWVLGDRLGCPLMQDDAMCDLALYYYDCHIEEDTLEEIYERSAPESKIRRFAIDKCLFDAREKCADGHEDGCSYLQFVKDNEDFAQQLAEATILLSNRKPKNPSDNTSSYLYAPSPCTSKKKSGS